MTPLHQDSGYSPDITTLLNNLTIQGDTRSQAVLKTSAAMLSMPGLFAYFNENITDNNKKV